MSRSISSRARILPAAIALAAAVVIAAPGASGADGEAGTAVGGDSAAVTAAVGADGELLTREQRLDLLLLKEAELALQRASNDFQRATADLEGMTELYERQVVSKLDYNEYAKEFESARLAFEQAGIELEKQRLGFLRDATHIAVDEAKKYRTEDGKRWAEILLRNASDLEQARILMEAVAARPAEYEELRGLLRVNGIRVSLLDDSIIGEPYEASVDRLDHGESRGVKFQLLKDVEELTVALQYLGTNDERKVFLKKEALQQVPSITSEQFSQEGKLGTEVLFDLTLERLSEEEESFSLVAFGLPKQIDARFVNPETKAALNQVKFTKERSQVSLDLELSIPEKLDPALVDESLAFVVVVARAADMEKVAAAAGITPAGVPPGPGPPGQGAAGVPPGPGALAGLDPAALEGSPCAVVELALVPRGVGELDVLISNRYAEIRIGQNASFRAEVHNKGTLGVFNTRLTIDPPYEWEYSVDPETIDHLLPGQRRSVILEFVPPGNVGVGDYDVRMTAEGEVGSEPVESVERSVTVRIETRTHLLLNLAVVVVVLGLILGIAITSVRMTRR